MPRMKITIIARLSVRSQRKGVSDKEGKMAIKTCGIVSPTMMQNAIIPPKALERLSLADVLGHESPRGLTMPIEQWIWR